VFRALAQRTDIDFRVYFCMIPDDRQQGAEFGLAFKWDVNLREGYRSEVLRNISPRPGLMHFGGCDTPGIFDCIRADQLDALVVNGWVVKSCLQGLRACRRLGIPCLVRGEANTLRHRPWWKRWLHRQLVRQFAGYLYIGASNRDFYRQHGAREDQLFPALYCVDNAWFLATAMATDGAELRKRIGLADDVVCYLYCGKFIQKKRPRELLQSFASAIASGANAHLLMVGTGELLSDCQKLVREQGLPVTFLGFLNQSEIVSAYTASDCLLLCSDHGETWGLVVNESMVCGRPAIVSDQSGCHLDLIARGVTGEIFAFGAWDELTRRLVEFSRSRRQLLEMGASARNLIERFSPQSAADGIARAALTICGRVEV